MHPFFGELIGTTLLILIGDGVVANVALQRTKGHSSGWIVITTGWAMAVFVGVFVSALANKAHLNPAVTISLAVAGKFAWTDVPAYTTAQFLGACLGAILVWLQYRHHFAATKDQDTKLGVFWTVPAIRNTFSHFVSEFIGTFVLVFAVLHITGPVGGIGSLDALPISLVIFAIGLALGGTTGYAINPARDLGPRLMHAILPIPNKRDSDLSYAWIPVIGPIAGGLAAVATYRFCF